MNRTITTTSTTRRRRSLRHAALALCAVLVALVAASCTADALDGTDTGTPSGNTNPDADVLTFAVGPRPGFTEVTTTRADGFSVQEIAGQARNDRESARNDRREGPATRATQTDNGTHWEQGDILWLQVALYQDKQDDTSFAAIYISALKYDGAEWRYLTEAEAEDLNTGSIPGFSRLVRWPRESKDWVAPGIKIKAYYTGNGKPDADGILTINPVGGIPTTPSLQAESGMCSPDMKSVPLRFMYVNISRVRIPAGYKVELTNTQYWSVVKFSYGIDMHVEPITEIPARSEATDVFLILDIGGNSTAKLTRDNVSYTFTFPEVTDAEGRLTRDGASYTLTPYTSGTETPGGYDLTIADEAGLRAFAQAVNAGDRLPNGKPAAEAKVLQTADIHLTQGEWVPIGNRYDNPFRGAYNGNGNEISGLNITTMPQPDVTQTGVPSSYAGLFGCAEGAVLTGIRLRKVKINITDGGGAIDLYVGSIAGNIFNSTLSLCTADGTVNVDGGDAGVDAGGIVGNSWYSTISRCRADVETKAIATNAGETAIAGGIAGLNAACSFILSCETQARPVTAKGSEQTWAGGITGFNMGATLIAFCRTGANVVTARNSNENCAGGLVGKNWGSIYSCYSRATAEALDGTGVKYAGAIVGYNTKWPGIQHCYGAGATGQGTSNLDEGGNIFYNANPGEGDIFRVMTGYGGKVEFIYNAFDGTYYPFTTSYAPSATPAYGIIPLRTVWTSDGAWNQGDGKYPALNIEEYEGRE